MCINILTFIFDSLYGILYTSATLVAPCRWLQFAAKIRTSIKNQLCN